MRKSWYNITIVCFLRGKRVYLRSLEIQGFKSFPDKTVLQFDSDITAIVGPNGSGKSNISDAISWVMGEQSSKALRGAKMEDVIFGGTQKRAAVGYAEATLVLDNQAGQLRIETPEVAITRRYYRSGESEYFINRQSARLRDINELLMDTGLGKEGYSNIGQGKVDEILALKSTDRREVFEEAAGISKYRHRKEETERRLANTEDNLLRIGDKISELELQVEPLREQAEKAKKYLALRDELKGLEVTVWLDGLGKAAEHAKKAETDYASAAFILEQAHDELTRLYSQSEQLSLQFNHETLVLDQMREEIASMETERQRQEGEAAVLEASITHQNENIVRIRHVLGAGAQQGIAMNRRTHQYTLAHLSGALEHGMFKQEGQLMIQQIILPLAGDDVQLLFGQLIVQLGGMNAGAVHNQVGLEYALIGDQTEALAGLFDLLHPGIHMERRAVHRRVIRQRAGQLVGAG